MISHTELRIKPLQRVIGGIKHHILKIVAGNLIAASLKHTGPGEGVSKQITNFAFRVLLSGFHGCAGFAAFRGIGHATFIQRRTGGLVLNEVMAKVIGRTPGDEHKNCWRLIARLPRIGPHGVFINTPAIAHPDANTPLGVGGKLRVKHKGNVARDL